MFEFRHNVFLVLLSGIAKFPLYCTFLWLRLRYQLLVGFMMTALLVNVVVILLHSTYRLFALRYSQLYCKQECAMMFLCLETLCQTKITTVNFVVIILRGLRHPSLDI